jgi:F-type H+-transporting ATPase subunit b
VGLLLIMLMVPVPASADEESPGHDAEASAKESAVHDPGEDAHTDDAAADSDHAGDAHAGGHGGGHHDPYDLGHQNASEKLEDPSEFKSDLAIWTFVVFLCLLGLLLKFAWRPIMEGLEKREQSIAAMIDEAKRSADKAAEQLRHYEAKLEAAGEEAREVLAQAQREAEGMKDNIVAEARKAAQRERERAVSDIETAKIAALQDITTAGVDLAVNVAGRILQRQLDSEDRGKLIREALEQFPSRN